MKKIIFIIAASLMVTCFAACGGKKETEKQTEAPVKIEETETESETETETEEKLPEGMMKSYLTNELISEESGTLRPFAIMTNNISDALPQYGISQAAIMYECVVEGNITRLMTVYEDITNLERMGSIRSARHYYIDLANDDDAIYCHYGWSPFAEDRIRNEGIQTVNGLALDGIAYYRASDKAAPHNVFTNCEMLNAGIEKAGISREHKAGYTPRFIFNEEDTEPVNGMAATKVVVPFSSNATFEYDAANKVYLKSEYGAPHIDANTGEQISFKNGIVIFTGYSTISAKGHQDVVMYGEGDGYYFTDGKAVSIKWRKADAQDQLKFYLTDGSQLMLNTGKTYIGVCPSDYVVSFE